MAAFIALFWLLMSFSGAYLGYILSKPKPPKGPPQ